MKRQGTLVRWEKDRGFGFIRCPEISADVFVHLRDFSDRGTTPQVGMRLDFDEIHVGGKGPRAVAVRAASAVQQRPQGRAKQPQPQQRRPSAAPALSSSDSSSLPMALLLFGYAALLGYGVWTGRIPPVALGVLLLLSLSALVIYGVDKSAARAGRWRIAESTLHLLSLAGGWPGAWIAQRMFRHKLSKKSFMAVYWATVLVHVAAVGAWVGRLVPAL
ncbi:cold shock and DUF1294 domain-containing protein [uncultured Variovorax sp.]|uniref:cold shock and DUF1294 domain-containing protein n=1 Tax=uncultured Variovorax sp. TaxID=114708 RepID=UPI0025F31FA0|nr:cold shock and DUF1294 domain-containing protein [uncultured Variovorax sp.]